MKHLSIDDVAQEYNKLKREYEWLVIRENKKRNRRWFIRLLVLVGFVVWYLLFRK